MSEKVIITCAVTGAETTRESQPALPVTPEEIASSAFEAWEAGAAVLHLHVRHDDGSPTQDVAVFRKAIELVRSKCDIVIECTTGGAVGMTPEERLQPVTLRPEMASLDCGTVNFGDDYIVNTLPIMRQFAKAMREHGVRPTLECFDLGHVYASHILVKEGLLDEPYHYGLVLNVPGSVRYEVDVLEMFVRKLPRGAHWTLMGIGGKANLDAIYGALALGGNIRVGFEDNIYYTQGSPREEQRRARRARRPDREGLRPPARAPRRRPRDAEAEEGLRGAMQYRTVDWRSIPLFADVAEADWNDWSWQMKNGIRDVETLEKVVKLTDQEREEIQSCLGKFTMEITPYYAALMDRDDPFCPVRMQSVPRIAEMHDDPSDTGRPAPRGRRQSRPRSDAPLSRPRPPPHHEHLQHELPPLHAAAARRRQRRRHAGRERRRRRSSTSGRRRRSATSS